jgi:hypothetical protein
MVLSSPSLLVVAVVRTPTTPGYIQGSRTAHIFFSDAVLLLCTEIKMSACDYVFSTGSFSTHNILQF